MLHEDSADTIARHKAQDCGDDRDSDEMLAEAAVQSEAPDGDGEISALIYIVAHCGSHLF